MDQHEVPVDSGNGGDGDSSDLAGETEVRERERSPKEEESCIGLLTDDDFIPCKIM